ncbi:MAG TPA: hypothetical protein VFU69_12030 [Ktedonobacterales bacterium]|nr:hypothetical protein [Ktedonobacterales bacterium]
MDSIHDDFGSSLDSRWTLTRLGGGEVACVSSILRLSFEQAKTEQYTDAQIDDYAAPRHPQFSWHPPLRLEVRARASNPAAHPNGTGGRFALVGTAGFGFWNLPFSTSGDVLRLPDAVWFFYASPPSQMRLVPHSPGWGWKAQVVHAHRLGALAAGLPTLTSIAWARLTGNQAPASHWVQRLSGTRETILDVDLTTWHDYRLEWRREAAHFWVDGELVFTAPNPPRGPLGFVAWIDNQYAIATPRGQFQFGTLNSGPQWLELDSVEIAHL